MVRFMSSASLDRLKEIEGFLLDAASAPSQHTVDSYLRRWRQWDQFAEHFEIEDLPASPENVAAFAVARHEAGVSVSTISSNLSAVRWVHGQYGHSLEVTSVAKRTLAALDRRTTQDPVSVVRSASVLSRGALLRMVEMNPSAGRIFVVRLVRLLTGLRPAALQVLKPSDLKFGKDDSWVEISLPGDELARLERGRNALECPVKGLRWLSAQTEDGKSLMSKSELYKAKPPSPDPLEWEDGVPWRIAVRDKAIVCVGYAGALRTEEMVRIRFENIQRMRWGYSVRLFGTKSSQVGAAEIVRLEKTNDGLDPVTALDEWIAVRGKSNGPLFSQVHHQTTHISGLDDGSLAAERARRVIEARAKAAGIKGVSGYSLRRTWATHAWLENPDDLGSIQIKLRHARQETTVRYIEDLRVSALAESGRLLDPEEVFAVGQTASARKNLGFNTGKPFDDLVTEAIGLSKASNMSPNTLRASRSAWQQWCNFAIAHDLPILPASEQHIAGFLSDKIEGGRAPGTIQNYVVAIRNAHRAYDQTPDHNFRLVADIVRGYQRTSDHVPDIAPVIKLDDLIRVCGDAAQEGDLFGLAVIALTYSGALRVGEVRQMRIEHIERRQDGLLLHLPKTKGTRGSSGRKDAVFLAKRTDMLDPVSAYDQWVGDRTEGAVLGLEIGSKRFVSADTIRNRFYRCFERTHIEGAKFHSLRRSWATHAFDGGVDVLTVSRHLRHAETAVTKGYIDKLTAWNHNPAASLANRMGLMLNSEEQQ